MAVQSLLRGMDVLAAVAASEPARVGEIATTVGLPKSTVQRLLTTLADGGWLAPVDGELTRWTTTSRLRGLAAGGAGGEIDVRDAARAPMARLRDQTNETVHLWVPIGERQITVAERAESVRTVRSVVAIGTSLDLVRTSAGIAMLATRTDAEIAAIRNASSMTRRETAELKQLVAAARTDRYVERAGWDGDVIAIGAAIVDASGTLVGGLSISFPVQRYDPARRDDWGTLALAATEAISTHLRT